MATKFSFDNFLSKAIPILLDFTNDAVKVANKFDTFLDRTAIPIILEATNKASKGSKEADKFFSEKFSKILDIILEKTDEAIESNTKIDSFIKETIIPLLLKATDKASKANAKVDKFIKEVVIPIISEKTSKASEMKDNIDKYIKQYLTSETLDKETIKKIEVAIDKIVEFTIKTVSPIFDKNDNASTDFNEFNTSTNQKETVIIEKDASHNGDEDSDSLNEEFIDLDNNSNDSIEGWATPNTDMENLIPQILEEDISEENINYHESVEWIQQPSTFVDQSVHDSLIVLGDENSSEFANNDDIPEFHIEIIETEQNSGTLIEDTPIKVSGMF